MSFLPYAVATWIVLVGLYGVVTSRNLIHLVLSLSVMQSASYLVLLSIGYKKDAVAPIFDTVPVGTRAVDPVVQALTLTDVVVGVTVTALLLALAVQAHKRYGTLDPEKLRPRSKRG
jgi:multicomponent Na+:H+ antiporter subunit C